MTDGLEVDIELALGGFALQIDESLPGRGITAIFGPSGSGKTSLLRAIAGLEPRVRGSVRFRGDVWNSAETAVAPEHRGVGFVFQDGRLFQHLNVRDNLLFGRPKDEHQRAIDFDEVVAALELAPLLNRSVHDLSGGEAQRVAIGRALLSDPRLLLMDEPLSSLDIERKRQLLPLVRSLPLRFDVPVLYVTHDMDELTFLADCVVLLSAGRNVARGSVREILARPDFARLAELDNPGTVIEARVTGKEADLTLAQIGDNTLRLPGIDATPGSWVRLLIHPRDVILATSEPVAISIRNCLRAVIESIEGEDSDLVSVRLSIGDQRLVARITRDASDELGLRPGLDVYALVKSVALDTVVTAGQFAGKTD